MATINELFVNVPVEVLASLQDLDLAVIPQPRCFGNVDRMGDAFGECITGGQFRDPWYAV